MNSQVGFSRSQMLRKSAAFVATHSDVDAAWRIGVCPTEFRPAFVESRIKDRV